MDPMTPAATSPASEPAAERRPDAARQRQVRLLVVGVAVAALVALFWPRADPGAVPSAYLRDAHGQPIPLASQLAPVTLVHFWATWCAPCIEETPALQRLAADYAGEPQLRVLFVAVAESQDRVDRFLGGSGGSFYDPQWEVARKFGTDKIPETYLLVDGRVAEKFVGATDWDAPAARSKVRQALTELAARAAT
ncbi:MAG TPA: TlpA disulfide reductase family protein [Thermoanaerobaculia bacterium]|nr:TlpA disulfide reductase family protein [Thermoanaerobaculia bacterium]